MTETGPITLESIVSKLTEAQLECLYLVKRRKTAKQIARSLNITHHAVEQRLKSVRRKLGVSTTAEAVDLLEAAERAGYGASVYGSSYVAELDASWAKRELPLQPGSGSGQEFLMASSPAMDASVIKASQIDSAMEFLFGETGAMPWKQRVLFMIVIAFSVITIVILLLSIIEGLVRLNS